MHVQQQCNGELRCILAKARGSEGEAWGGSQAHPELLGRLDEEEEGRSRRRLAWSAAHVTDEERESGQCTTPWLESFGGMVEDVEVQLPMVFV